MISFLVGWILFMAAFTAVFYAIGFMITATPNPLRWQIDVRVVLTGVWGVFMAVFVMFAGIYGFRMDAIRAAVKQPAAIEGGMDARPSSRP